MRGGLNSYEWFSIKFIRWYHCSAISIPSWMLCPFYYLGKRLDMKERRRKFIHCATTYMRWLTARIQRLNGWIECRESFQHTDIFTCFRLTQVQERTVSSKRTLFSGKDLIALTTAHHLSGLLFWMLFVNSIMSVTVGFFNRYWPQQFLPQLWWSPIVGWESSEDIERSGNFCCSQWTPS